MATIYAIHNLMLRSLIISAGLIACSAAGAVALATVHSTSFDVDVAHFAAPEKTGAFVIPSFAPTRSTADVVPVALNSAVTPLPQPQEDRLLLTPVITSPTTGNAGTDHSATDTPRDSQTTPQARPLPAIIALPDDTQPAVTQPKPQRIVEIQTQPQLQNTSQVRSAQARAGQPRIGQAQIVPQVSRDNTAQTGRIVAMFPEYVIGVYR